MREVEVNKAMKRILRQMVLTAALSSIWAALALAMWLTGHPEGALGLLGSAMACGMWHVAGDWLDGKEGA